MILNNPPPVLTATEGFSSMAVDFVSQWCVHRPAAVTREVFCLMWGLPVHSLQKEAGAGASPTDRPWDSRPTPERLLVCRMPAYNLYLKRVLQDQGGTTPLLLWQEHGFIALAHHNEQDVAHWLHDIDAAAKFDALIL
jgi:hypothetical protein